MTSFRVGETNATLFHRVDIGPAADTADAEDRSVTLRFQERKGGPYSGHRVVIEDVTQPVEGELATPADFAAARRPARRESPAAATQPATQPAGDEPLPGDVTREAWDRVASGMSREAVHALLGEPGGRGRHSRGNNFDKYHILLPPDEQGRVYRHLMSVEYDGTDGAAVVDRVSGPHEPD